MNGMSILTGKWLSAENHLKQSIIDIISTPQGSRVMLRDYGSDLYLWIDAPLNATTKNRIYAATAKALQRWEPRFKLQQVEARVVSPGKLELTLTGKIENGATLTIEGLELSP